MRSRIAQFLLAELLAFGAFVCGGVALLGATMTWAGDSRHSSMLSWLLVTLCAGIAIALGRTAALRFRRVFARAN